MTLRIKAYANFGLEGVVEDVDEVSDEDVIGFVLGRGKATVGEDGLQKLLREKAAYLLCLRGPLLYSVAG